jgi:hypothetical protein
VQLDNHRALRHRVRQLVHQQLPTRLARRVGVEILKVAELRLTLEDGAHCGARRLDLTQ